MEVVKEPESWVHTWQNFVTAFEVIQLHHEQYLIERGWPHITGLLMDNLILYEDSSLQQEVTNGRYSYF